jgi:hypothetical protein
MHQSRRGNVQGKCVRASVSYVPSYSTKILYESCGFGASPGCVVGWRVDNDNSSDQWAEQFGLPSDRMWTETYNEDINVAINLRESSAQDKLVLGLGIASTALVFGVVWAGKAVYKRKKQE